MVSKEASESLAVLKKVKKSDNTFFSSQKKYSSKSLEPTEKIILGDHVAVLPSIHFGIQLYREKAYDFANAIFCDLISFYWDVWDDNPRSEILEIYVMAIFYHACMYLQGLNVHSLQEELKDIEEVPMYANSPKHTRMAMKLLNYIYPLLLQLDDSGGVLLMKARYQDEGFPPLTDSSKSKAYYYYLQSVKYDETVYDILRNQIAFYNLALMYQWDEIDSLDAEERDKNLFLCYEKSANLGHAASTVSLASCYRHGRGCAKNYERTHELCHSVLLQNSETTNTCTALILLFELYLDGEGCEPNTEIALEYLNQAIKLGSSDAMNLLGELYEKGEHVPKDLHKALSLYSQSQSQIGQEMATQLWNRIQPELFFGNM